MGHIAALDAAGRPCVSYPGLVGPPPIARLIGAVPPEQLEAALREARPVLLAFLDGRADAPVIMSLQSMHDLAGAPAPQSSAEPEPESEPEPVEVEVEIDGEGRQVIAAERELVLRCGDAAIVLRSDGTVRITGRDITSWARRRQRIRGGSVAIN